MSMNGPWYGEWGSKVLTYIANGLSLLDAMNSVDRSPRNESN